jgi:hypothetical protein
MQLLARARNRLPASLSYGFVAYWTLNALLIAEEARWHLLYRLTIWDVAALRTLGLMLANGHGHGTLH